MPRIRLCAVLVVLLVLAGCAQAPVTTATVSPPERAPVDSAPPAKAPAVHARILAVGDLLMHVPLVTTSALPGGGWDFKPLFAPVRPWLEGADLAMANLETTLTGPSRPWAGYPTFNTPPEFARDVRAVGFQVLTNANNHALDYRELGLTNTADALNRYGLLHTGAFRKAEERDKILVVNVTPEIRMAILAYSYGVNGAAPPHPWSVNLLDKDRIRSDIRRARELGVDLVAVAYHFGVEDQRQPNDQQKEYVDLALQAGADIILGDHPHVIQRIEVRHVEDDFGRDLPRAVIFSEGNFLHVQFLSLQNEAGLMLLVDVVKDRGVTKVERVSFIPTWVHRHYPPPTYPLRYRVVAVEQALRDYEAGRDPLITKADYARLQAVWADTLAQVAGSPEVKVWHVDQPARASGRTLS